MAAKRGHKKSAKRGAKKGTKKRAKSFAAGGPRGGTAAKGRSHNVYSKRRGAHIPIKVLEKRLKSLNAKVKARGGKHY